MHIDTYQINLNHENHILLVWIARQIFQWTGIPEKKVWYLIVSIPDLCTLTYFNGVYVFFKKYEIVSLN